MAKYNLIKTAILDDGTIMREFIPLPSKPENEREKFIETHEDLMRRWQRFQINFTRIYAWLKDAQGYIYSIAAESLQVTSENEERLPDAVINPYRKLEEISWTISQTYGCCDAEATREALDEAEQVIEEIMQAIKETGLKALPNFQGQIYFLKLLAD